MITAIVVGTVGLFVTGVFLKTGQQIRTSEHLRY